MGGGIDGKQMNLMHGGTWTRIPDLTGGESSPHYPLFLLSSSVLLLLLLLRVPANSDGSALDNSMCCHTAM